MNDPRQRALRSDAAANRERILEAAERIFDERGIDTPIATIIRELGIGAGTFYRHFPKIDDLYVGVYDRVAAKLVNVADSCSRGPDSWKQILAFIDGVAEVLQEHPSIPALMRHVRTTRPEHDPAYAMRDPLQRVARAAIKDGHVRPDLTGTDIAMIPFLLTSWVRAFPPALQARNYDRARALLIDGITRLDSAPLPGPPATANEFRDAVHGVVDPHSKVV